MDPMWGLEGSRRSGRKIEEVGGAWKALGGVRGKMGKSLERSGGVDLVFA